jgi:hypothetical protein
MTRRVFMFLGVLAAISVIACKRPSSPEVEPAPESSEPVAAPTHPDPRDKSTATPSAHKLPVAEDFQAETAAAIVQANYRAELDALETELHAEAK